MLEDLESSIAKSYLSYLDDATQLVPVGIAMLSRHLLTLPIIERNYSSSSYLSNCIMMPQRDEKFRTELLHHDT